MHKLFYHEGVLGFDALQKIREFYFGTGLSSVHANQNERLAHGQINITLPTMLSVYALGAAEINVVVVPLFSDNNYPETFSFSTRLRYTAMTSSIPITHWIK
ncbi:hypothetical protein GCM10008090_29270 [Arenicella chitinivorans]|uniref:Uncharacterized protein n=1 Tax=Arenicella chitinivorans TaxID=1329800 RepID=A0A918S0L0_9GAMM|nr:hypothetical protein GCM10008090_29270 [Arenicella chitinivorans]